MDIEKKELLIADDDGMPRAPEKPWSRNEELSRLSSEIHHWEDIKGYHLDQVRIAGKEIALRYNRINEIYKTETPESRDRTPR